jgi:hypothetical protein
VANGRFSRYRWDRLQGYFTVQEWAEFRMLVATSEVKNGVATSDWADRWRGPRVLVALPGSTRTPAQLQALEDRFIVVECLQQPVSAAWLLCEIMTRLRHLLDQPDWPLVFTADAIDPDHLAGLARSGAEDPWCIRHRFDAGGTKLEFLLLGKNIASNPLAPAFFDFLRGKDITDADFVALLDKTLAWGQE